MGHKKTGWMPVLPKKHIFYVILTFLALQALPPMPCEE